MEEEKGKLNTEDSLLLLLRAALHREKAELPGETDWMGLFRLAGRHHILPLILEAAWQSGAPKKDLEPVQYTSMRLMAAQTRRTAAFLNLYRELAGEGFCPVVLKGLICRLLYPEPDLRPSNDEDLMIGQEELPAVHERLLKLGLKCTTAQPFKDEYEIAYSSPDLHLELHLSPFLADSKVYGRWNDLFEGALSRTAEVCAEDVPVRTLSPTDHLLYLICHASKHFLHSGVGIRQICDIALFSEHYKEEIDWQHLREACGRIRIEGFAAAVYAVSSRRLGFDLPAVFSGMEIDEGPMLQDIFSGGIYGAVDENRAHSAVITLEAAAKQNPDRKKVRMPSSLFPPAVSMARKYPCLKKHPWLLPGAWIFRILHYLRHRGGGSDTAESLRIGRERVELLKKYGII